MSDIRKQIIDHIQLLANASAQIQYEKDVPAACVPDELICGFVDDLFHPKSSDFLEAFTENEIKELAELYGLLCLTARTFDDQNKSVSNLQKNKEFRIVMSYSKELSARFEEGLK